MPSTKNIDLINSPMKILLISTNGFGKSIAAGAFYKAGKIHFDEADIRMKPVAAYYPGEDIRYDSWTSDNFKRFVDKIHGIIDGTIKPDYKTWVLDSITSFSIACITYQLKVKDKIKTTTGGLPATGWEEINGETVLFHEIMEAFQIAYTKYKCNIIWTAHPVAKTEKVEGEDAKRVMALAAYGNKIPSLIPGFFDEIYNIQIEKVGMNKWKRRVYTVPKEGMPGKTALYNYLPESMDITNKNFYDVLRGHLEKGKEEEK